jgi:pimeloyl-ACP methyl ester carboxylesterase
VVIALPGLGASEHAFMEAYGAGLLPQLANEQDFIAVSPRMPGFTAAVFDSLIAQLGREVPVDTMRIYVLGHAAGAAAAWSLARQRAGRIAAVACISYPCGSEADSAPMPPTLSVVGALDGVTPPARVDSAAALAIAAGRHIEYEMVEGVGHTFVVGATLPDVVTWLMGHRLSGAQ